MKNIITIIIAIIINGTALFGQKSVPYKETEHFIYNRREDGFITIYLKNRDTTFFAKGWAVFGVKDRELFRSKYAEQEFQPVMEVFSCSRIKELKNARDPLFFSLYFDESGEYRDIVFCIGEKEKTLVTDDELYQIVQKYRQCRYDMSACYVRAIRKGSKTVFYNESQADSITVFYNETGVHLYYDCLKNYIADTIPLARINGNDFTYITNDKQIIKELPNTASLGNVPVKTQSINIIGIPLTFKLYQRDSSRLLGMDILNHKNEKILSVSNKEGWGNLKEHPFLNWKVNDATPFFIKTDSYLRGPSNLFILYGGTDTTPGFVTIIAATQNKANVVFNRKAIIKKINWAPFIVHLHDPSCNCNIEIRAINGFLYYSK